MELYIYKKEIKLTEKKDVNAVYNNNSFLVAFSTGERRKVCFVTSLPQVM